jgi:hypothetical protein
MGHISWLCRGMFKSGRERPGLSVRQMNKCKSCNQLGIGRCQRTQNVIIVDGRFGGSWYLLLRRGLHATATAVCVRTSTLTERVGSVGITTSIHHYWRAPFAHVAELWPSACVALWLISIQVYE